MRLFPRTELPEKMTQEDRAASDCETNNRTRDVRKNSSCRKRDRKQRQLRISIDVLPVHSSQTVLNERKRSTFPSPGTLFIQTLDEQTFFSFASPSLSFPFTHLLFQFAKLLDEEKIVKWRTRGHSKEKSKRTLKGYSLLADYFHSSLLTD